MSMITQSKIGTKIRCIITCCVRGNVEENVDEEKDEGEETKRNFEEYVCQVDDVLVYPCTDKSGNVHLYNRRRTKLREKELLP